MEWNRTIYRGFYISVAKLRSGSWTATAEALPEGGAMATAGPGEGTVVGGDLESEEAAVNAGKKYIDQRHSQRREITLDMAKELIFQRLCRQYTERLEDPYMEPRALRIELGIPEELFNEALASLRSGADLLIEYDTAARRIKLGRSSQARCENMRRRGG